jgi:hypothetical protein
MTKPAAIASVFLVRPSARALRWLGVCLWLLGGFLWNACQDPGCIRNSECDDGYQCKASLCVPNPASDNADDSAGSGFGADVLAGKGGAAGRIGSFLSTGGSKNTAGHAGSTSATAGTSGTGTGASVAGSGGSGGTNSASAGTTDSGGTSSGSGGT